MGRIYWKRVLHFSSVTAMLLALLAFSPAVHASVSDTASYEYKVTGFDYHASGQLDGGRFQSACTPVEDSLWEGEITTAEAEPELSALHFGNASLEVHPHGTSGDIDAEMLVESKFSASHTETTACESNGDVASIFTTPCNEEGQTKLTAHVKINGRVGNRVKLTWDFFLDDGGSLVPSTFTCVKPFQFPEGSSKDCSKGTRTASLGKFTAKKVKVPFLCLYSTTTPPRGSNYTRFGAVAYAKGALFLRRTTQH
jgi:hypothetical protein